MEFRQQANRPAPLGAASLYQTYQITAQPDRWIVQACKEAGCEYWATGWDSPVDERTEQGKLWAFMIRKKSGRKFKELRRGDGVTVFRFDPYQRCFREHRTKQDLLIVRHGDWRGNPSGRGRVHVSAADWVEDFQEHEGALADLRQKG